MLPTLPVPSVQVTVWLSEEGVTAAVNCCVVPGITSALSGDTATWTGSTVTSAVAQSLELSTLHAFTVMVSVSETEVGAV